MNYFFNQFIRDYEIESIKRCRSRRDYWFSLFNQWKYILKHVNKKEFEDINITINLQRGEDNFDIDINIDLDTDANLPEDLAQTAVKLSLDAVDEYVENRNKRLD